MKRVYVHPLPVRLWHWTNAIGFVLLILGQRRREDQKYAGLRILR